MPTAKAATPPVVIDQADLEGAHETFIQVRKSLVRKLGGNVNAMAAAAVLSAIQFQTKYGREGQTYTVDGVEWWRASLDILADWTGLARSVVHRMILLLLRMGVLRSAEHKRGGRSDRTKSYRIVVGVELTPSPTPRRGPQRPSKDEVMAAATQIPDVGSGADPTSGTSADPTSGISHLGSAPSIRGDLEEGEGAAAPPPLLLFPDQCSHHQDKINDDPCGGCGRARRRHEEQLKREAAQRAAEKSIRTQKRCSVPGHQSYPASNCGFCRSEEIERQRDAS